MIEVVADSFEIVDMQIFTAGGACARRRISRPVWQDLDEGLLASAGTFPCPLLCKVSYCKRLSCGVFPNQTTSWRLSTAGEMVCRNDLLPMLSTYEPRT